MVEGGAWQVQAQRLHSAHVCRIKFVIRGVQCRDLAAGALIVPLDTTVRIQEMHIFIGHVLSEVGGRDLGLA